MSEYLLCGALAEIKSKSGKFPTFNIKSDWLLGLCWYGILMDLE
jgi:hypothetical protein